MIINPKATLYLYFDAQLRRLREEIDALNHQLRYNRRKHSTVDELLELARLMAELETTEKIFLELNGFF